MLQKAQPINVAFRHSIQNSSRLARLRYYAEENMDVLKTSNINPMYDGRTIPYSDIEPESITAVMEQIAVVMDWAIHEQLNAPEEVKIESIMINRWSEGDELGLHADNAYWQPGTAQHMQPNYTPWRTHSAVYYINDDYEGGNLYFENGIEIIPKADTVIAFSAGLDAVHGVTPVTSGTRWTVAAWFTDDPKHYHGLAEPWAVPRNDLAREHLKRYG